MLLWYGCLLYRIAKENPQSKEKCCNKSAFVRSVRQPVITADGQMATVEQATVIDKEITVYDDPICQMVDIFDFFVDPNASEIEDARYCGHREYQNKEQLENMVKNGKYKMTGRKLTIHRTLRTVANKGLILSV